MIPEVSDPPTAGLTPNPFPPIEADRKIAHIASIFNKTKSEALKFAHIQMLEDLGRKAALLEVHNRLSGLNSWDKESPAPQDPHHAFMKQEYRSLVEKEKQTRMILMNQEQEYYDAVVEQDKLLKQHYEGELENQEREITALKVKHKSLHEEGVRVLSEENFALKEKLKMHLADVVVLLKDVNDLKDGLEDMKEDQDKNLVLAHRQAKSNEALRMRQLDLETQLKRVPVLEQQVSDYHEALNPMRKEFLALPSVIPAQAKHQDEYIQALDKKLVQIQKNLHQLSVHDYQQTHFNETMNAKHTILVQKQQENMAYLMEKQACFNEALNRKQKVAKEQTKDHARAIQALEAALANVEIAHTDDSTDQANSHEALKEIVMRLKARDYRRQEYSKQSKMNAASLEALVSRMKMLESNIKDQKELVVLTELIQPNLASSLNNKKQQGELEDELEDRLSMMRRLQHQFNLLLSYLFLLIVSGLIFAVGFGPICRLSYYSRR